MMETGKRESGIVVPDLKKAEIQHAPKTRYCKSKSEFDEAVGQDFIKHANSVTESGEFIVGLSHGQSPSGPYEYIIDHYHELKHPDRIYYTCVNSKLMRQRGLIGVTDALSFLKQLIDSEKISKDQILGRSLNRENIQEYCDGFNSTLTEWLTKLDKPGLDYIILASDPKGQVAGITRNSEAFNSEEPAMVVQDTTDLEITLTPSFIKKTGRIAFIATKAEKRRPLAWLFYKWPAPNESPSFLRYMEECETRVEVFIDDQALTWPQIQLQRTTDYGETNIKLDLALPYNENSKEKLPIILMIHGFLGLNTFDALLAFIPSHKYLAAAMHYGSIPYDLPPNKYCQMVVENINHAVNYFGENGHDVIIFDHSMANNYLQMIDRQIDRLDGIRKYVKGRISSNPFFGQETKHASLQFLDQVILKSKISKIDRLTFSTARRIIPLETKKGVRNISILIAEWLIKSDSKIHKRIWEAIKQRVMLLVSDMDMLPTLNRVPLEHTLNRLPIKVFAIQIQSALRESKKFDRTKRLKGFEKYNIPVLILKSEIDPIAKFLPEFFEESTNVEIVDITNRKEKDLFREHLFYMIYPYTTIKIIDQFVKRLDL